MFGVAANPLPGAGCSFDNRIDRFEMAWICGQTNFDLRAGTQLPNRAIAEVIFYIAVARDRFGDVVFVELRKNDAQWKAFVRNPTVAPPGVESFLQVQARAVAAVERWRTRETSGAYPAFVAHADVIKLLMAHYAGLEAGQAGKLMIDNASVSIVELEDDQQLHIVALSWNPRPGWLKPPAPAPEGPHSEDVQAGEQKVSQEK